MHKIRDWLYISDYSTALSAKFMREHHIKALLLLYRRVSHPDTEILFLPVYDASPIREKLFRQAITFIRTQHQAQHPLLSSCGAGVSRSVIFAMLALHEIEGLTMREAYLDIHAKHPDAMPDHQHWESLRDFLNEDADFWQVWQEVMGLE